MPLPPSIDRQPLHVRSIEIRGWHRADGDFDIDGHLTDVKTHTIHPPGRALPVAAGAPVHDMSIRLVIDAHFVVKDIVAVTDAGPYLDCPQAASALEQLRGARIAAGWTARVKGMLGKHSCTHLVELLIPMATAAYQTLSEVRLARGDVLDNAGRPVRIDSCYAYAEERDLVRRRWPAFHRLSTPE